MDIEKLTKSQIVLLTLLTSFVASIATGIVTVSLMEQAPPAIAQTVNRVVERTVERVVPSSQSASASTVVTETVVVRESDLVAQAVESIGPSIVRLFIKGTDEGGKQTDVYVGMGVVVGTDGTLIADGTFSATQTLRALRSDGSFVPVIYLSKDKSTGISRLRAGSTTEAGTGAVTWRPAIFASGAPHLGDSIIAIAGRTSPRISHGLVTGLGETSHNSTSTMIETSIPEESYSIGSPLINVSGEVVGFATAEVRNALEGGFLASSEILLQNTGAETPEVPNSSASN